MAHECGIHEVIDPVDLARIAAEEGGREFGDAGFGAQRVGGDVSRSERSAFTPTLRTVVARDPDDRRVERLVRPAKRHHPKKAVLLVDRLSSLGTVGRTAMAANSGREHPTRS